MKKIFNICLLLAVTAGFVACSDDNDAGSNYLRENPVQVVNSKLTFTAAAQKGGVKFTAPAGSTVSVSDSWATAQLQNDSYRSQCYYLHRCRHCRQRSLQ